MAVTAELRLSVTGRQSTAQDLGSADFPFSLASALTFTSGTGANQVDRVFTDRRTLAASATEDLDLAAVLTDAFGAVITMAEVVAIVIKAAAGNTNNVNVTRPASAGVPIFLAASDGVAIPPGGFFAVAGPGAAGLATVTATTADLITVTNSGAGTPVTYDVIILGRSA